MRLLDNSHNTVIAEWVGRQVGVPIAPPYTTMGWIDGQGLLRVGFIFYGYSPHGNIDLAIASTAGFTRGIIRRVASYIFEEIPARRATARPPRKNETACSILRRCGFVQETVCKDYYADDDAVQFRLLRKDAMRWLNV